MREVVADLASQPIRNMHVRPIPRTDLSSFGPLNNAVQAISLVADGTGPPHAPSTQFARVTWTVASTDGGIRLQPQVSPPVRAALCWVRCSKSQRLGLNAWHYDSAGNYLGSPADSLYFVDVSANVWTEVSGLIPLSSNPAASKSTVSVRSVSAGGGGNYQNWAVGDTLDVTMVMLAGSPVRISNYADGNTPGWRWTNLADGSESVGYPYTLESIAGPPALDLLQNGQAESYGVLTGLATSAGRTLYSIYEVNNLASTASAPVARLGSNTASTPRVRLMSDDVTVYSDYYSLGSVAALASITQPRAIGRHVASLALSEGMTQLSIMSNVNGYSAVPIPENERMFNQNEVRGYNWPEAAAIRTLAYRGEHNTATRARVMAWLSRQYGAPIPAGY